MDKLISGDPDFEAARLVAIRARILEFAAKDKTRLTEDIAGHVRQAFRDKPSVHMVRRTLHAWNERGLDALFPQRRGPKKGRAAEQVANLRLLVEQYPDATPKELAEQLGVSRAQLYRVSRLAGIRFPRQKRGQSH
jgi:transposase